MLVGSLRHPVSFTLTGVQTQKPEHTEHTRSAVTRRIREKTGLNPDRSTGYPE
jgi:hypothetical protein